MKLLKLKASKLVWLALMTIYSPASAPDQVALRDTVNASAKVISVVSTASATTARILPLNRHLRVSHFFDSQRTKLHEDGELYEGK